MDLSLVAAGWLIGICVAQQWRELPGWPEAVTVTAVTMTVILAIRWMPRIRVLAAPLLAALLAMVWVACLGQNRLAEHLAVNEDDKVTRVVVLVSDLPTQVSGTVRFTGVLQAPVPDGLPRKVMVFWPSACTGNCDNAVEPGQRWRMALRFRQPHARMNFAGLDGEGWMFQQGLRATATVRGTPKRLTDASGWQPGLWIEQVRSLIRRRLHRLLQGQPELNVMVALAIGDQQGVAPKDWAVFNLTGITHLVSISGSHVTLIAALGAAAVALLYGQLRWRARPMAERLPVRLVFVWSAGVLAFLYCLLAGWGVPAQRTFFMLAAAAIGLSGRVPLTGTQAVLGAGAVMTVLDPWAVLSTGFWLSFGAMCILIMLAQQTGLANSHTQTKWQWCKQAFLVAARMQWIMTLAITPVTIYLFQQLSLIGLLANAWAIPWITFVATPLALLISALCLLPLPDVVLAPVAWLAHASLYLSLAPVRWLAGFEWLAIETRAIDVWALSLGIAGVVTALLMPPWRWRWLAWLLLLPALTSTSPRPELGHWRLTAFDVGQGGAVLVQTRSQALLFDTGWRYAEVDAVEKVVLPELRAYGIKHLDRVVISHPDNDHVGGLQRLEQTRSIGQLVGSGLQRPDVLACQAGQRWQTDGVVFEFLHPDSTCSSQALEGLERNRCSCVLLVSGHHHRALLTGDIDASVEQRLLGLVKPPIDVVMVAHHGSRTSSHAPWVEHLRASHAVIQAGHYNRFGHPHADVLQRWRDAQSRVWVSSHHGAVQFMTGANGIEVKQARAQRQRYWHTPDSDLQSNNQ